MELNMFNRDLVLAKMFKQYKISNQNEWIMAMYLPWRWWFQNNRSETNNKFEIVVKYKFSNIWSAVEKSLLVKRLPSPLKIRVFEVTSKKWCGNWKKLFAYIFVLPWCKYRLKRKKSRSSSETTKLLQNYKQNSSSINLQDAEKYLRIPPKVYCENF